ncbi:MAG: hypothetical protein FWG98_03345 [Candidatus Cloacimonetes bacterium]|nr:hypothetical protein [Candidatus Cloacimonadota bacterium]
MIENKTKNENIVSENTIKRENALKELLDTTADSGQIGTLRLFKKKQSAGKLIYDALMKRLKESSNETLNNGSRFYLNERDRTPGLMTDLYGIVGLLSLINSFEIAVDSKEDKEIIQNYLTKTISYIEEYGYDLSPYLDEEINEKFFHKGRTANNTKVDYIGARTWAFSMFLAARKAQLDKKIDISHEQEQKIFQNIRENIRFFINNFIDCNEIIDEKDKISREYIGYGYANGCEEPSLFFTYSVVEAFADFDDNCLNLSKSEGSTEDVELLKFINEGNYDEPLQNQFMKICFKIGDKAWDYFEHKLKKNFFEDKINNDVNNIEEAEIEKSSRSSVLFNSLYVIFILFYTYKNNYTVRENIIDEDKKEKWMIDLENDVKKTIVDGLLKIQQYYNKLKELDLDSIVEKHIINFDQPHDSIKRFGKELNAASIQASSLLPLLARVNNLVASHIHRFPQKDLGSLFDLILESKLSKEWLWENRQYDLLTTARYIEAIADFYNYYDDFERDYTTTFKDKKEAEESVTPTLEKKLTKSITEQVKKSQQPVLKRLEEEKKNEIAQVREEYIIENSIIRKIHNEAIKSICDTLDEVSRFYVKNTPIDRNIDNLNKNSKLLCNSLNNYFESRYHYPLQLVKHLSEKLDDDDAIKELSKKEIDGAVLKFFEFIVANIDKPEEKRTSLKDIFILIEKKNKEIKE